jgi:hypothetical protein
VPRRDAGRSGLAEVPEKIRPLMETQETRIMKCAPFFVERLKKMLAAVK